MKKYLQFLASGATMLAELLWRHYLCVFLRPGKAYTHPGVYHLSRHKSGKNW